jgi:serine/threonine protein kinase
MLKGELDALKIINLPHPFIIEFYSAFHNFSSCYLTFELAEGGDLRSHLNTNFHFTERMVAYLTSCLSSALHHIHTCGVLHRDIKPENILLTVRGIPKLIDFGIAYICPDTTSLSTMICTNASGTRLYSAPELFTLSHAHGPAADFWSLGVVLYEMLFLTPPYHRHCPKSFMTFAIEYSNFLNRAQPKRPSLNTGNGTITCTGVTSVTGVGASYRSVNVTPSSYHHSNRPKIPLDDDDDDERGNSADKAAAAVVVSEEFEKFNVEILPPHLRIYLPASTAHGDIITIECLEFLNKILDIRHDRRMGGTEITYGNLLRHPWLHAHGMHIPHLLKSHMMTTKTSIQTTHVTGSHSLSGTANSHHPFSSPIHLNHQALQALILKRQQTEHPNVNQTLKQKPMQLKQRLTTLWAASGLINKRKSHQVIPQNYQPDLLEILESYQYPPAR